jgi:tetratricopeptide (TPR) repeat protein
MDLIGQYLFRYTFESPDNRHPLLIGSNSLKSDIHQTAEQSLATSTGGICRGDCDDLSELYQRIALKQGRIPHVILLPGHAALAYAEESDDGWAVEVLRTGTALRFEADTLPEALGKTYRSFDPTGTFDPNAVGLLLRFSGENRRSAWRLSHRIFSDADYAQTMIDVQRDWHYQTYAQAIEKMEVMIAAGDEDNANFRELAGLYAFTGQYDKAAAYLAKAIERTPEASSRFQVELERLGYLRSSDLEAAKELAYRLIDKDFEEAKGQLGIQMAFTLPRLLIGLEDMDRARSRFKELAWSRLARATMQVMQIANANPSHEQWNHSQVRQMRRIAGTMAGMSLALLKDEDLTKLEKDSDLEQYHALVTSWLRLVAFKDADDGDAIMARYATMARYYERRDGEDTFRTALAKAKAPNKPLDSHHQRGGLDKKQQKRDLKWISISLPYWSSRLSDTLGDDGIDEKQLTTVMERARQAYTVSKDLGMSGPRAEHIWHQMQLFAAVHGQDEAALRERMRHVLAQDDKALRDSLAGFLGSNAKHLSAEWWDTILTCWAEEIDCKPKYFWIAWQAAIAKAPEAALATARLAVERFPDEAAFAQELSYMEGLLAESKD